jgi:polar amino acid transport system substrate-binding protein
MARRSRRLILLIASAAFVAAILFFGRSLVRPELSQLLANGVLRIGIDPSNPPFAMPGENGSIGFEIEVSRAIGDRLHIPIEFVGLGFDGLYDALAADHSDVIIANVPIDLTRTGAVNYSLPYYNAGLVLVSDGSITQMTDVADKQLAIEYGSVANALANEWLRRVKPFQPLPYEQPDFALDAVRLGDADTALVDSVSARMYLSAHDGWYGSFSHATDVLFSVASRADRGLIGVYINEAVESLLADGTIENLIGHWF